MLPLFDMMMQAQNGHAMEAMARQFGLAQEQAGKAMAALMPAFSTGLKRTAADPYDFTRLMGHLASGNYAAYFEDMTRAFTPEGTSKGNEILGQIFGSKEVSRAIAAQAAQLTGIGQDILKQMLPAMATAVMGGLMKQGMGQLPSQDLWTNSPQARMMEQWLEATGFKPKPKAPEMSLFDNPFTQSMQALFGQTAQPAAQANPFAGNPFAGMMTAMMEAMGGQGTKAEPEAAKPAAPATPDPAVMNDLVNQMFDSGLEVQKTYQKNMDQIFETYLGAFSPKAPDTDKG